jgi:hypothetical protein
MPFQILPAPTTQLHAPDILGSLLKAQQFSQSSQMFPQQLQSAILQNQFYPKGQQADINLKNAETQNQLINAAKQKIIQNEMARLFKLWQQQNGGNPQAVANSSTPVNSASQNSPLLNQSSNNAISSSLSNDQSSMDSNPSIPLQAIPASIKPTNSLGNQQISAGMSSRSQGINNIPSAQPNLSSMGNSSSFTYPQAEFLSKSLGLPESKIIDVNGTKLAITPFGNIPVAQGPTLLQQNLAKEDAKAISNLEDVYDNTRKNNIRLIK